VKVIKGRKYYLSRRVATKSDREEYLKALNEYQRLLPEILAGKSVGSAATRVSTQTGKRTRNPKKRIVYAVREYHRSLDERTTITKGEGGISKGRAVGVKGWTDESDPVSGGFQSRLRRSYPHGCCTDCSLHFARAR
jgi:hypothetical protein